MKSTKKFADLLDVDPEIAQQKFACVSFISPEKIPEPDEVSVNLYGFKKFSPDEILIA